METLATIRARALAALIPPPRGPTCFSRVCKYVKLSVRDIGDNVAGSSNELDATPRDTRGKAGKYVERKRDRVF